MVYQFLTDASETRVGTLTGLLVRYQNHSTQVTCGTLYLLKSSKVHLSNICVVQCTNAVPIVHHGLADQSLQIAFLTLCPNRTPVNFA